MLKIDNLTKYYGKLCAVDNISFEIKKGEIFGFIGPNGCGKSTTIRSIFNMLKYEGIITFNGLNTKDNEIWKKEVGYLPSEVHLYEDLTVKQMLNYSASFYKEDLTDRIDYLTNKLKLDITKKTDELSFGNSKKVGIVIALMHNPKLLILDEPTSGLDPIMQDVFFELLEEEKEKGTTIFFSSHILSEVKRLCDRVAIMKSGKILRIGTVKELTDEHYLIVTLEADNIKKQKLPLNEMIIKENSDNRLVFIYKGNVNDLVTDLSKIKLKGLWIEEPSIEEVFSHYYK